MIRIKGKLLAACFQLVIPVILVLAHPGCGNSEPSPPIEVENENILPNESSPASSNTADTGFTPFDNAAPIEESRIVEAKHIGTVEEDNVQFAPDGMRAYAAEDHIGIYDVTTWE